MHLHQMLKSIENTQQYTLLAMILHKGRARDLVRQLLHVWHMRQPQCLLTVSCAVHL